MSGLPSFVHGLFDACVARSVHGMLGGLCDPRRRSSPTATRGRPIRLVDGPLHGFKSMLMRHYDDTPP